MRIAAFTFAALICLAGCRTICPGPGLPPTQFNQDSYECMKSSQGYTGSQFGFGMGTNRSLYNACMLARGHVIKRGGCD